MVKKRGGCWPFSFLGEMLTATAMSHYEDEIARDRKDVAHRTHHALWQQSPFVSKLVDVTRPIIYFTVAAVIMRGLMV